MRGFPQSLETKQDYLNCLDLYPEETKSSLRRLMADRFILEEGKELSDKSKGKEDLSHYVQEQRRMNEETGVEEVSYVQMIKKEDTNARVFQLGFTLKEIESLI